MAAPPASAPGRGADAQLDESPCSHAGVYKDGGADGSLNQVSLPEDKIFSGESSTNSSPRSCAPRSKQIHVDLQSARACSDAARAAGSKVISNEQTQRDAIGAAEKVREIVRGVVREPLLSIRLSEDVDDGYQTPTGIENCIPAEVYTRCPPAPRKAKRRKAHATLPCKLRRSTERSVVVSDQWIRANSGLYLLRDKKAQT
ncbi:hypothetical protein KP509_23G009800 [Ceratopteris richardii]|uniref:Uncharacterized protein n=1 Tax=Ceratopteris richardii TaxID=49495 RepID=A0A8T2RZI7_CERRI|nr:hypothetical protein KP509_23G009800 [Ceratopteris richardii]